MRRLFVRVYAALFGVLLLGLALVWALRPADGPAGGDAVTALAGFPSAAARTLAGATDAAAQDAALRDLADRFGHPVTLVPRVAATAALPDTERGALDRGEPVTTVGRAGAVVYVPLGPQPFVATLGPIPPSTGVGPLPYALVAALLGLAVVVTLLLRPLDRQLTRLSEAARRLGDGDLTVRAVARPDQTTGPLADAFNEMADRIQALIESRQDLLNAVSHELRGPLQRIRFGVDLLELTDDAAERSTRVAAIQHDVEELDALVDELLAWSRLGAGTPLAPEDVAIGPVIAQIAEDAGRLRPSVAVAVDAAAATARVDRRLFQRAITNLIGNAVRYADARVAVTAHAPDGVLEVVVDDDGPGVPASDRERIFEPFVRLDAARARDTGGVGLGLALVARIAALHDARVTVGDGPLGGASFRWRGALAGGAYTRLPDPAPPSPPPPVRHG